jgi:hypothetical protein
MLRNIISQTQKVKPNNDWFDLSKKDEPENLQHQKHNKFFLSKTIFNELGIAMKITTSSKTSHRENINNNQEI